MKLYDEHHNLIGTVRDSDLFESENAIMPVSVRIDPPKRISLPSGYYVMAFAGFIACISLILTIRNDASPFVDVDTVKRLSAAGLFGTGVFLFVPLSYLLQLSGLFMLSARRRILYVAAGLQVLLGYFAGSMIIRSDYALFSVNQTIVTALGLMIMFLVCVSMQSACKSRLVWSLFLCRIILLLMAFLADSVAFCMYAGLLYYMFETAYWILIPMMIKKAGNHESI